MHEPDSLLLVHIVEKQEIGYRFVRSRGEWPLHITLVPWFALVDESLVVRRLAEAAADYAPFTVQVGARELFGRDHDVPVNLIANQEPVKALHESLTTVLRELGAAFHEEHWMGEHFQAHITRHESQGRWRTKGDTEQFDDFHLVRLLTDDVCEVAERFVLGVSK